MLLALAIITTIGAFIWAFFIAFANMMSSVPTMPFQGRGAIIAGFVIAAAFWIGWLFS